MDTNTRGHYKAQAYEEAVALRKRGLTYSEIAKITGVSRGTVSAWLAHEDFSREVAIRNQKRATKQNRERIVMINKARTRERATHTKAVLKIAETEYKHYRHSPLFAAGLAVYLSVGDQKDERTIRLVSRRIELQKLFIRFSVEFLGVDRKDIRFWLLLYPEHDEVACMKRWMKHLGLSAGQFYKNQVVPGRSQSPALHFGVGNTIIGGTLLKQKLLAWLALLKKETIS